VTHIHPHHPRPLRTFYAERLPIRSAHVRTQVLLACAGLAALVAGCAAPVGVKRIPPREAYRQLTANALTSDEPSDASQTVLRRYNLVESFDHYPAFTLGQLRTVVVSGRGGNDEVFALAELSYLYAVRSDSRPAAFAAALYAYAFLFPDDPAERPQAIDPRYRGACDLYAESLMRALRSPNGKTLDLTGGTYPLPFGTLQVDFDRQQLDWGGRVLIDFVPVAEYDVIGLRNRYRQPGIGVPLSAKTAPAQSATPADDFVGEKVRVPATAVLTFEDPRQQLRAGALRARLDVYAATEREDVTIDGEVVPLAIDRSAAIATTLADTAFWNQELSAFLGNAVGVRKPTRLAAQDPYRPGLIPVVFVHGTNSSPGRWADMVNDLQNDPRIRTRFQFWFFTYDSGNPIGYSAMLLRRALRDAVARYDPDGRDPCLQQMVVIGHSQGGLLTKMTVIDSGSVFWDNISKIPFDQAQLSEASRALLQEGMFIKPLPFVTRVVFIATPHHGSYLAGPALVRRLAAKLISLPRDVVGVGQEIFAVSDPSERMVNLERVPTSLDNMSAGHPFIKSLSSIPITPGVAAHSIIPVQGDRPLADEVDGVVAYQSAHIEGVESERIIHHSSHSTQSNPDTIDEVRRILLLQAELHPCAAPPPASTSPLHPTSP
jgi:pimeloyl-ACP methyl ester carboxylesterase